MSSGGAIHDRIVGRENRMSIGTTMMPATTDAIGT